MVSWPLAKPARAPGGSGADGSAANGSDRPSGSWPARGRGNGGGRRPGRPRPLLPVGRIPSAVVPRETEGGKPPERPAHAKTGCADPDDPERQVPAPAPPAGVTVAGRGRGRVRRNHSSYSGIQVNCLSTNAGPYFGPRYSRRIGMFSGVLLHNASRTSSRNPREVYPLSMAL